MLPKTKTNAQADAVIAFPTQEDAAALADHLDDAFGVDGWRAAPLKSAKTAVDRLVSDGGAFLIVGLKDETDVDVETARALIELAKGQELRVILLA